MTKRELAIISAYIGAPLCDILTFNEYVREIMDLSTLKNPDSFEEFRKHLKEKSEPDFLKLTHTLTDD